MRSVRGLCAALAVLLPIVGACNSKQPPTRLQVVAAASLADSFKEVGSAFEAAHPGVKVDFSFGGSNQLRTQLENAGPGDVFASADRKQMDAAAASKVVDAATIKVFAHNRLALIVPKDNRAGIRTLADLARPGLKIVVGDKSVPVGNYTRLMLEQAAQSPLGPSAVRAIEANIVSREENVAAVVAKVALSEADAGFAYASDAAGASGPSLTLIALPPELDHRAEYVVAVTSRASNPGLAASFVAFLLSKDARAILKERGYSGPDDGTP
jgi:molybdate transport system substrate-binding protein